MQLEKKHQDILFNILKKYPYQFFLFGSRAKNTAKTLSDIDLLIKEDVSKINRFKLREAFEDSNLPMKVDLVFWGDIDDNFRNHIKNDLLLIE